MIGDGSPLMPLKLGKLDVPPPTLNANGPGGIHGLTVETGVGAPIPCDDVDATPLVIIPAGALLDVASIP